MTTLTRSILLAVGISMLAGCSGGGDEDGGPAAPRATITSANAPTIASAVMAASFQSADIGAYLEFGDAGVSPKPSQAATVYAKTGALQRTWLDALAKPARSEIFQAPFGPETSACTGGGTSTVSGNVANPSALTPNDRVVIEFAACREDDATVNGRFALTVSSFSGDIGSGVFTLGVTVELTAFQVTVGSEQAVANGTIAMTVSAASATLTTTIASNSISVSEGGASHTLGNYSLTEAITGNTFTLSVAGELTSTAFAGGVTFQTSSLLQGMGDEFAYAGAVLITGANGATIRVVALDSTFVRLEVDLNGDGTIEEMVDTSWAELV